MSTKILLNIKEVAITLSLSRATVYKLVASHQLRTIKIGRSCRIASAEVERYVRTLSFDQLNYDCLETFTKDGETK